MRILALLISCCWASSAAAQIVLPPELCLPCGVSEQRLLNDLADGRLDQHSVLEAALAASGASEEMIARSLQVVSERVALWKSQQLVGGSESQRAAALLLLMHRDLLGGGYRHDASDLADTLCTGRFNCVSATLLWQHLAAEFQITAVARQLPGHLQSVLLVGGQRTLVETTCPRWFMLVSESEPAHAVSIAREGAVSSGQSVEQARELDDAALIASVYYNRGLAMLAQREFAAAVAASYTAHRLDPESAAARGNLLATLNNWALYLAEHGQTSRAVWLLETGLAVAPEHESFRVNLSVLRKP